MSSKDVVKKAAGASAKDVTTKTKASSKSLAAARAASARLREAEAKADPTAAQAMIVNSLLKSVERKLRRKEMKPSLGDYFPNNGAGTSFSGMPFYDAWNTSQFLSEYGHAMSVITTNSVSPASYPDEVAYLPAVIGNFTNAIMSYVRLSYAACRFEVLYPTDVNQTSFNQAINYPATWTPAALNVLKTESIGFTLARELDQSLQTIEFGASLGFTAPQRSHLVSISDATTPWIKEVRLASGMGFESVVLFALDQFCLIGYPAPLPSSLRRSWRRAA